jgi:glycosyltransferase involved in cell wall biosynthesis
MTRNKETLVFIPTYNDKELLGKITGSVSALPGNFVPLVVDDGSFTAVDKNDLAPGSLLVRLPTNFGLGTATHVAFDHAIKHGYGMIARLDSDGQHPVSSLPDLIRPLIENEADMVVGQRLNRDDGTGLRALFAKVIRWYLTTASSLVSRGQTPRDMNTGFFAVTTDAARKFNTLILERYPEPQIFLSARSFDIKTAECMIKQNDREYGHSSINLFQAVMMLYRFHMLLLAQLLQTRSTK